MWYYSEIRDAAINAPCSGFNVATPTTHEHVVLVSQIGINFQHLETRLLTLQREYKSYEVF